MDTIAWHAYNQEFLVISPPQSLSFPVVRRCLTKLACSPFRFIGKFFTLFLCDDLQIDQMLSTTVSSALPRHIRRRKLSQMYHNDDFGERKATTVEAEKNSQGNGQYCSSLVIEQTRNHDKKKKTATLLGILSILLSIFDSRMGTYQGCGGGKYASCGCQPST